MSSTSVLLFKLLGNLRPRYLCVISPCKIATIVPHISTCDAPCKVEVIKTLVFVPLNCNPMSESSCALNGLPHPWHTGAKSKKKGSCANVSTMNTNSSRDVAKIMRSSAYRRFVNLVSCPSLNPSFVNFSFHFRIACSNTALKRSELRTFLCRTPRWMEKISEPGTAPV